MVHLPLPPPRWRRQPPSRPLQRISTAQAISLLRAKVWAQALGLTIKNGFAVVRPAAQSPPQIQYAVPSALLTASG
jgi:hypothetical protein